MATLYACSPKMGTQTHEHGLNTLSTDRNGSPMLIGRCTQKAMEQPPFGEWFNKNYAAYMVDKLTADSLKAKLQDKTFTLFLGTWCGDSKREVPHMLRLLQYCGVAQQKINIVLVSNHDSVVKQSPTHEERGLNIHRVPTLLVYEGNRIMGRIVEEPVVSLEKDLLTIVSGLPYATSYKGADRLMGMMERRTVAALMQDTIAVSEALRPLLKNFYELHTYAHVSLRADDAEKALLIASLNARLFPAEADVHYRKGFILQSMGRREAAAAAYERALQLKPDHELALKMLRVLRP